MITQMQAGAQEVEDAKGAAILRRLDTENLRSLLSRNHLQVPGNQGDGLRGPDLPGAGQGGKSENAG